MMLRGKLLPTSKPVAERAAERAIPHPHHRLESFPDESLVTRQFRLLTNNILKDFPRETGGTILFSGVGSDRHVADVAENVARQLAATLKIGTVALVDGDAETRTLTERLAGNGKAGLAEVLQRRLSSDYALAETAISGMRFLPFGDRREARNPISSDTVKAALADLRHMCTYTIVAAGTGLTKLHAMFGRHSDGTYLVVRLGAADRQDTSAAANYLTRAGARLLGCVATSVV